MRQIVNDFFETFVEELKTNENLRHYHRFINSEKSYLFRRAYYQQRLEFIARNIKKKNAKILDIGCGYGTTSILLASFGHEVIGTTLEYYFSELDNRLEYWKSKLDTSLISFRYENIFDSEYPEETFDYIIAQDTLHHIEPIDEAMKVFKKILKPDGKLLISEENDNNLITSLKRFKMRGFNRITTYYDEKLGKEILFGNENTRSLKKWKNIFSQNDFLIDPDSIEFIRILPPSSFKKNLYDDVLKREQEISRKSKILREFFFFGINFTASKKNKKLSSY